MISKGYIHLEEYDRYRGNISNRLVVYKRKMSEDMKSFTFTQNDYTEVRDCGSWWVLYK